MKVVPSSVNNKWLGLSSRELSNNSGQRAKMLQDYQWIDYVENLAMNKTLLNNNDEIRSKFGGR